jgi:FAD/FMN-containing dehydrogenase
MARAPGIDRYFALFEDEMRALSGRPHWGKQFAAAPEQLRAAYPLYDRFDDLRRRLDPRGVFENDYLRRVFGSVIGRAALPSAPSATGSLSRSADR